MNFVKESWSGYTFKNPSKNRGYIKVLNILYWAAAKGNAEGIRKNEVHEMMGWPTDHGNHSGMWTDLNDAGYVKYDKSSQTWKITSTGIKYLDSNDLILPFNEIGDGKDNEDTAKTEAPAKDILDILLQSLAIVSRSNAGEISVEDLADQTALRHYDVEEGLLELQRQELADTDWNDEDGEENMWFITGRGAISLRKAGKIPVKGTTISDVASGRTEYEGAPAAKKPDIDLDDDMYDNTPVVKQRDESTKASEKTVIVEMTEEEFEQVKKILEAYDAVTDHQNAVKSNGQFDSYAYNFATNLARALKEAGYATKTGYETVYVRAKSGSYRIDCLTDETEDSRFIGNLDSETGHGIEKPTDMAYFSEMENFIELRLNDQKNAEVDRKKFDIRNIPSMVKWIGENINI